MDHDKRKLPRTLCQSSWDNQGVPRKDGQTDVRKIPMATPTRKQSPSHLEVRELSDVTSRDGKFPNQSGTFRSTSLSPTSRGSDGGGASEFRSRSSRSLSPMYVPSTPATAVSRRRQQAGHRSPGNDADDPTCNHINLSPTSPGSESMSPTFRDIYSPVPTETTFDLEPVLNTPRRLSRRVATPAYQQTGPGSNLPSSSVFPAITIETCDAPKSSQKTHNKHHQPPFSVYPDSLASSQKTANSRTFEGAVRKTSSSYNITSCLNVPSPIIRRRTTEGRIIVGLNNDFIKGALNKMWSRSEGNLPASVSDDVSNSNSNSYSKSNSFAKSYSNSNSNNGSSN
ncbi:uncharacterized protein LOC101855802 [Aplysia californica]|uniref:Uncharacterized protein LOC101855802 n=1 Tax=Aplysia californica TaxID=6500 RepID=A0ABM0JTQ5_APLCA|nr:uncharacterized protein LOC101855802 [Aplysia californica]